MRSLFGASNLSLYNEGHQEQLRREGYSLRNSETRATLQPKADLFEVSIQALLTNIAKHAPEVAVPLIPRIADAAHDTSRLVLDTILQPNASLDICRPYQHEEYAQLVHLLFVSRLLGTAVPVAVPVCPDYGNKYELGDGVGSIGKKALYGISALSNLLRTRGFDIQASLHLADVEGNDPLLLSLSKETKESFTKKVRTTAVKIQEELVKRGLDSHVAVGLMSEFFAQQGIDYDTHQHRASQAILGDQTKKVRRVLEGLSAHRSTSEDLGPLGPDGIRNQTAKELGGYVTYGHAVSGHAIILSPDAMSAIPAYNFFKKDSYSPTILVKKERV